MSNYDWFDHYDPFEQDKKDATRAHCGKAGEHKKHQFGTRTIPPEQVNRYGRAEPRIPYDGPPFYNCPGTPPRMEVWKGMKIYFHDDGKVTWEGDKR